MSSYLDVDVNPEMHNPEAGKHTRGPYLPVAPYKTRDLTENGVEVVDSNGVVQGYAVTVRAAAYFSTAPELLDLLRELMKAGNANTRAVKDLARERLAEGFFADVRAAISRAEGKR